MQRFRHRALLCLRAAWPSILTLARSHVWRVACLKQPSCCVKRYDHDPCIHAYTRIHTHSYEHTYMHTYIHTNMHTCIHTYEHAYMHTYIRTCSSTYTCVHAYLRTCIHTYIHAYIHAHIRGYKHNSYAFLRSVLSRLLLVVVGHHIVHW